MNGQALHRLQAVVLDWAGTTVDFGCQGPLEAFMESFEAFGVPVLRDEAREPMGMKKRDHVAAMFAMPRITAAWLIRHGELPSEKDAHNVYTLAEHGMLSVVQRHSIPIAGAVNAVREMRRRGLSIGSCTGYPRSVAAPLAENAAALGYAPDILVCATDVPHARPAPDMCIEALARLGVSDPARAVKIGDTLNDVYEGVRAGMWVIGLTLCGALIGVSEEEMSALSEEERNILHDRASWKLINAGAHFTAPDLASCLPILDEIQRLNARDDFLGPENRPVSNPSSIAPEHALLLQKQ